MGMFYSPDGNFEIWAEKPTGYLTPIEWADAHPPVSVQPSTAELAAQRRTAITTALTAIDAASARPLRAILAAQASGGSAATADVARITELEAQAVALRTELAELAE